MKVDYSCSKTRTCSGDPGVEFQKSRMAISCELKVIIFKQKAKKIV